MKKINLTLLLVLMGVSICQAAYQPQINPLLYLTVGNSRFVLGGSLRTRFETQTNYNIKQYGIGNDDAFLLERLRLDFDYRLNRRLRSFLQIQDSHALGLSLPACSFKPSNPYFDPFDIRQGFLEFSPLKGLDLKLGRQQISYGNGRILGPGQWGNTGRYSWDAVQLTLNNSFAKIHFMAGRYLIRNPNKWPNPNVHFPTGYVIYSHIKPLPFYLDTFFIYKRDRRSNAKNGENGSGPWDAYSVGFYFKRWFGHFFTTATWVYQWGWWGKDKIRAYGYNLGLGYRLRLPLKPYLQFQYTCGSGDKDPGDGIHGTFDGVFGGVDRFYGRINFFGWMNLRDYEADLNLSPHKNWLIKTAYHYFRLDDKRDAWYFPSAKPQRWDKSGHSGRDVGQEIDAEVIWRFSRYEWRTGVSGFFPLAFIKNTGPAPDAYWYYFQGMIWF